MKDIQELKKILQNVKQNGKMLPPRFIEKLDDIKKALSYFKENGSIKKVCIGVTEGHDILEPNFLIVYGNTSAYNNYDEISDEFKNTDECLESVLMSILLIVIGPGVFYRFNTLIEGLTENQIEELI